MALDIVGYRLHNQLLSQPSGSPPEDIVTWLGAVQSQDYAGAKWALAQRSKSATTDAALEQAFTEGKILRTHVMRPTWHFLTPADIRWMLDLTAPRVKKAISHMDRQVGVDTALLKKSHSVLKKVLQGNRQLTRLEIAPLLKKSGIEADGVRLGHLLMHAELDQVICSGGRQGKQFTYALLEERAPQARTLDREQSLAELARRYFRSHGPATLQDFVWWSGLTATEARNGIEAVAAEFEQETMGKQTYWFPRITSIKSPSSAAYLLPSYDEYTVGYRDRSAIFDGRYIDKLSAFRESILTQVIVIRGEIAGTWKRTIKKNEVVVEMAPFTPLKKNENRAVAAAAQRYGGFLQLPVMVAQESL